MTTKDTLRFTNCITRLMMCDYWPIRVAVVMPFTDHCKCRYFRPVYILLINHSNTALSSSSWVKIFIDFFVAQPLDETRLLA
jgi:hypothetical protein